jgi:hypothetical protein
MYYLLIPAFFGFRIIRESSQLRSKVKQANPGINIAFFFFMGNDRRYILSNLWKSFMWYALMIISFGSRKTVEEELSCYMETGKILALKDSEIQKLYERLVSSTSWFIRSFILALGIMLFSLIF